MHPATQITFFLYGSRNNFNLYLDLLTTQGLAVHGHGGRLGVLLSVEGDESETLPRVVHVSHHSELLELVLGKQTPLISHQKSRQFLQGVVPILIMEEFV